MPSNTEHFARERTEAELRAIQARTAAILEVAIDCIVTIDHAGHVVDWNPAAERTFGYTFAEATGREMAELVIPPTLRERHRLGLKRAVDSGQDTIVGQRIEIMAMRKGGEEFPVELAITRIATAGPPLFTGHIRDITERKQAEQALRESQQLLASITHNISEGIFRRLPDKGLVYVNEAYLRMFGFASLVELNERSPAAAYVNPQRRSELLALLERHGQFNRQDVEYVRKDGSTFWGLVSSIRICDPERPNTWHDDGAIVDITERKRAEQRQAAQYGLARVLAEAATLAEATPKILRAVCESLQWDLAAIWIFDRTGTVLCCVDMWHAAAVRVDAFEATTRYSTFSRGVGLPGRIWASGEPAWIPDVTQDTNFPRASVAAQSGLHGAFGFPIRLGQEVLGVIEFFSREIRQPNADVLQMFAAIGSQIGQFMERKQAEEEIRLLNQDLERRIAERTTELRAANRQLEKEAAVRERAEMELQKALAQEKELSRLKSNFVTVVSHEFRTPLGIIMSATEILESYFDRLTPERRREHLFDIRDASRLMSGLMEEVLLLGRVEAGRMEFKPAVVDLRGFCQRVIDEILSATHRLCPIEFTTRKLSGQATGDEALLRHIFINLLSNAVKYSPPGRQVQFTVERQEREAVFQIRDRGIGISEEDLKQLFQSFHRGSNVGERPGTGLGLVIVKRCVELHGGDIKVESKRDEGTIVTVRLPLFLGGS